MPASPYATVDDLHAYLGADPPPDSQRLLARAQDLIDTELISSIFLTDANGNPTDANVIAGVKAACVAQVEFWIQNGDELDQLGNWVSYNIAGVAVTRDPSTSAMQRRIRLCPRAHDVFRRTLSSSTVGFYRPMMPGKPVI